MTLRYVINSDLFKEIFKSGKRGVTQLTCKGNPFVWSTQCESSFNELKQRLTTAPILILPKPNEPFVVYCDASKLA